MNVLVIGGTGVISRQVVNRLLEQGHEVTTYNRGTRSLALGEAIRRITGDRQDRAAFESRMGGVGGDRHLLRRALALVFSQH